jgi:hypothetical protein
MGRKAKYPFLELQPGQTVVVRTTDTAQAIAAAAWRASRQASDLLGEPVRFSVRRRDPEHYYLTRPLPGDDMTAEVIEDGAKLPTLRVLTDEELQAQRDAAYAEKVRRQLREKFIRQKIEAEMEAELEEQKFELEKARRLRKARAEEELATELAKIRAAAKQKADAVEFELEREKNKRKRAAYIEAERESEQALGEDGLPEADPDLYAELTEFKNVLKAEGIGPEQPAK